MRHSSGLASFDLASAVLAATSSEGTELTLAELARAFCNAHADASDLRLRKWVQAFGGLSAWAITSEQLETAAQAMREHGYGQPRPVNARIDVPVGQEAAPVAARL